MPLRQVGLTEYDSLVVLAVIMALLINVFFLFRVVPWSRPGSWRLIFVLAAVASFMFILAEAVILSDDAIQALATLHQAPLFAALLAGAAGFFLVYTDAYRAAERARILALTDTLTELPSRRAFEERLKVSFERRDPFTVLYIDLDGFKQVNDRLGHAGGDQVLQRVGAILRQCVRQADMAARIGGDEFCDGPRRLGVRTRSSRQPTRPCTARSARAATASRPRRRSRARRPARARSPRTRTLRPRDASARAADRMAGPQHEAVAGRFEPRARERVRRGARPRRVVVVREDLEAAPAVRRGRA